MLKHSVYILYLFLQVWRFPSRQMSQVVSVDPIKPFSIRGDKVVASTRKCKNLKLISPQLCDIASCLRRNCIGSREFFAIDQSIILNIFCPIFQRVVELCLRMGLGGSEVGWLSHLVGGWLVGSKKPLDGNFVSQISSTQLTQICHTFTKDHFLPGITSRMSFTVWYCMIKILS